jgi:hypothetical protein
MGGAKFTEIARGPLEATLAPGKLPTQGIPQAQTQGQTLAQDQSAECSGFFVGKIKLERVGCLGV